MKSQALWSILINLSPRGARRSQAIFKGAIDFFAADGTMQTDGRRRLAGGPGKTSQKAYMIDLIGSFHRAEAGQK